MHTLNVRLWATGMAWSVSHFCRDGAILVSASGQDAAFKDSLAAIN
jgi:hypothetical protein